MKDDVRRATGGRLRKAGPKLALAAALSGILAGCSSCGSVSPSATLQLAFVRPVDGQQLTLGDETDPLTPGFQSDIQVQVQDSKGGTLQTLTAQLQLRLSSDSVWTSGPGAQISGGAVSFSKVTLPAGIVVLQVTVSEAATQRSSTGTVTILVPTVNPPVISNVVPPQSNLFCVANSNYHLFLSPPTPGYLRDKIPDGNCEADFSFTVANANGGVASLIYGATTINQPITADPQTINFINAVLPQKTSGQLRFQATNAIGDPAVQTANLTVDVVPPAPSTVTKAIAPGAARVATVGVSWTASGDDGDAGTPAGYDVRWSTNAVLPGTIFDGGYVDGGIRDDSTYFDLTKVVQEAPLPSSTLSTQLTPLPPLASYSIQVRAFDAIGNYARISPQMDLANFLSSAVLVNPRSAGSGFGSHLAKADFDLDGADDLVVGAGLIQPGAVWIYYGGPSFGSSPPQLLTPPDGQAGNFGLDFSTGNVGNLDSAADLLISQNTWGSGRGRAFLYFGRRGAPINPSAFVEFRGTNLPPPAGGFSGASRIISDINGDGLGEVLISAHRESANVGKVFLFYGRSESQWIASMTATDPLPDGGTVPYIPTSAADRIFTGDGPPDNFFGRLRGYADLGNLMGDGGMAFTIPASLDTVNKEFIYSGPVVQSKGDGGTVAVSDATQTLYRASVTDGGTLFGFGYEALGNVNFVGGLANDLVVTQPRNNQVLIYPDGTPTGFATPPEIINGINNNFGAALSYGDINLDGRPDLVVGENSGNGQQAWIFYNRGIPGSEFDPNAGAGFSQSRLFSPNALGIGVVVGDFNGDGKADVAAGDNLDGNGKVTVWY